MGDEERPTPSPAPEAKGKAAFAHYSEAEFANILDFYEIEWEYEPRTFPLRWDADGRVLQCFTPDFYLPEFDLFIELTTLRQKLVTKKNKKLRLLRELYPGTHIKLFYGKDIRSLLAKYGVSESRDEVNEEEKGSPE